MKTALIAFALLAATSVATMAAEPAMMMDAKGGKALATEKGMMLYTFDKDANGKSMCNKACMKEWKPFHAEKGAKAEGKWSLVKAMDGKMMWAYDGKPLYTYADDKKAGDMMGDGYKGMWHIVK
nr:hypothetical protein [uncultured Gellertiella sp.]